MKQNNIKPLLDQLAFYKKAYKNDRDFQFWQEGMHPQLIENETVLNRKSTIFTKTPSKEAILTRPNTGVIPALETTPANRHLPKLVAMRSHAEAWECISQITGVSKIT